MLCRNSLYAGSFWRETIQFDFRHSDSSYIELIWAKLVQQNFSQTTQMKNSEDFKYTGRRAFLLCTLFEERTAALSWKRSVWRKDRLTG
jgi:hypothetical protein